MKRWLRSFLAALGIGAASAACADELAPPEPATSNQFEPGQVWRCKTRPGEEASRVVIGKVEKTPETGIIVHVKLTGLRVKNPSAPGGVSMVMSHAPVSEAQVSASVTKLTEEHADLDGFAEGYSTWLSSFREGDAGAFAISLSEIAEYTEQTLSQ